MIKKIISKIFSAIKIFIRLSHLSVISRDLFKKDYQIYTDKVHLDAAMRWLCKSQDVTGCGGSSAAYYFTNGWGRPYPETTGYIISTFLKYAALTDDSEYLERAILMGDWEIKIQLDSGAVRGGMGINEYPIVFNTGQVILGWTALYQKTKLNKYIDSAIRATDWLLKVQDHDGKWSNYSFGGIPHSYHTRVAWAILEVYKHTNDEKYKIASKKYILQVLSLAKKNAWFHEMNFATEHQPLTHSIAYTLRGLIECSFMLGEDIKQDIVDKVTKAAENIMLAYELNKKNPYLMPYFLPASFNENWDSNDNYSCLTGNAQLAIIWLKVYSLNNDARLLNSALKIIDQLKMKQNLNSKNSGIRGGIPGSYPIWGKYMRYSYTNWSTKFFADAIMLQEKIIESLGKEKK